MEAFTNCANSSFSSFRKWPLSDSSQFTLKTKLWKNWALLIFWQFFKTEVVYLGKVGGVWCWGDVSIFVMNSLHSGCSSATIGWYSSSALKDLWLLWLLCSFLFIWSLLARIFSIPPSSSILQLEGWSDLAILPTVFLVDSCEGRCLVFPCTSLLLFISDSNIGRTSSLETAVSVKLKEENLLIFDKEGELFKGLPFLKKDKSVQKEDISNLPLFEILVSHSFNLVQHNPNLITPATCANC